MDDFFLQPHQRTPERLNEVGGNVDRERFLLEVLKPLKSGEAVLYRKFNCSTMQIEAPQRILPTGLTVIEGAYSTHPLLYGYYSLSVFLDVSEKTQRERILVRNTPRLAERFFNEWIPMERAYFGETGVKKRCDIVIEIE